MARKPLLALVAFVVATVAASCGGSGSSSKPKTVPTTAVSTTGARVSASQSTASSSDTPELLARTLDVQEIGDGWAITADDSSLCDDADKMPQRTGCADASYQDADTGEAVREMIGSYAPQGAVSIVRDARLKYGNEVRWQLLPTTMAGDEAMAAQSRVTITVNIETLIRSGDLLILITYHAPRDLVAQPALDLQSMIQRAVTKAH